MKIDEIIVAIQELIDETFGKPGHSVWINGQAVMLKKLAEDVKSYEDNRVIKVIVGSIIEEELKDLAREYEDEKRDKNVEKKISKEDGLKGRMQNMWKTKAP